MTTEEALSKETLSGMEIDVIGEVMNISMGTAATAMSSLLSKKVNITTPRIETIKVEEFEFTYLEPVIGVLINYVEGIDGSNVLLLKESDMKRILAQLFDMDVEDSSSEIEFDEISKSAIGEIMNQMMGAAAGALASFLGKVVNISPPVLLDTTNKASVRELFSLKGENLVSIKFHLSIEDLVESEFISAMEPALAREIVEMSMNMGGGEEEEEPPPPPAPPSEDGKMDQQMIDQLLQQQANADDGKMNQRMIDEMMQQQHQAPQEESKMDQQMIDQMLQQQQMQQPQMMQQPQQMQQPQMMQPQQMQQPQMMQPQQMQQPQMMQQPQQMQQPQMMQPQPMQQMVMKADQQSMYQNPGMNPYASQAPIQVAPYEYQSFDQDQGYEGGHGDNLDLIMSVPIQITVELGKTRKKIKDIAELTLGNIVELDRQAGDQVDVIANGRLIARGDVVVVDDNYSVKITEIMKVKDHTDQKNNQNMGK